MSHLHRFYHATPPDSQGIVQLTRDEAHHAMRVLRVRNGDAVALFNGVGTEWRGTISTMNRNEVAIAVESERFEARPAPQVRLAQAWLHRDKLLDEIVRQATVLGAAEIVFFRADHSEKKPKLSDKWERLAIEACKQCGRLWLPQILLADDLAAVVDRASEHRLIVARMEGPHVPISEAVTDAPVTYVVGPEGDFSPAELAQIDTLDTHPISLGSATLRAEMAAFVGLTLVQHHLGQLGPLA